MDELKTKAIQDVLAATGVTVVVIGIPFVLMRWALIAEGKAMERFWDAVGFEGGMMYAVGYAVFWALSLIHI